MWYYVNFPSIVGQLKLVASHNGLSAILWEKDDPLRVKRPQLTLNEKSAVLVETMKQLNQFFKGKLLQFNLPLDLQGTDFQKKVWDVLARIPYGKTCSYLDVAKSIKQPTAVRAVGSAIGKNPISIVIPCHRVIGTDGKLTGFAGGLPIKKQLLELEAMFVGNQSKVL